MLKIFGKLSNKNFSINKNGINENFHQTISGFEGDKGSTVTPDISATPNGGTGLSLHNGSQREHFGENLTGTGFNGSKGSSMEIGGAFTDLMSDAFAEPIGVLLFVLFGLDMVFEFLWVTFFETLIALAIGIALMFLAIHIGKKTNFVVSEKWVGFFLAALWIIYEPIALCKTLEYSTLGVLFVPVIWGLLLYVCFNGSPYSMCCIIAVGILPGIPLIEPILACWVGVGSITGYTGHFVISLWIAGILLFIMLGIALFYTLTALKKQKTMNP